MSHTPRKIELLAPAKDYETGIAAINHGADAVYIGAAQFGARQAAGNSVEDIARLVDYAHIFGVKVYVTLNTIIYDEEVGVIHQAGDILNRVAGSLSRTELRCTNVHGIGTMVYCSNTCFIILCRSKEFYLAWSV